MVIHLFWTYKKLHCKRDQIVAAVSEILWYIERKTDILLLLYKVIYFQVHWVIQFDPPSNAENFVHRCGRTARIGNQVI